MGAVIMLLWVPGIDVKSDYGILVPYHSPADYWSAEVSECILSISKKTVARRLCCQRGFLSQYPIDFLASGPQIKARVQGNSP